VANCFREPTPSEEELKLRQEDLELQIAVGEMCRTDLEQRDADLNAWSADVHLCRDDLTACRGKRDTGVKRSDSLRRRANRYDDVIVPLLSHDRTRVWSAAGSHERVIGPRDEMTVPPRERTVRLS
jgi:hypothetical protein